MKYPDIENASGSSRSKALSVIAPCTSHSCILARTAKRKSRRSGQFRLATS